MRKQYRKVFDQLKALGVPVYEHVDDFGNFSIDAECAKSDDWVSYYSMNPDWEFGMNPKLSQTLMAQGMFAEWVNPGRLAVYTA